MIAKLGYACLIVSALASLVQSVTLAGQSEKLMQRSILSARALFALMSGALLALVSAYVVSDFSVLNVVENSHTLKPLIYKITGVWGNHEGSMLLWVWMLSLWGFCVAQTKGLPLPLKSRVLGVQGMISFGFVLFILFTSNPFIEINPAPPEGLDLNPVLQDIGLAIHPPLLYTGYVGFSIAFCFAVAALLDRKVDDVWAAHLRPWVLSAWIGMTAGIVAGAAWAYYELGWGGFWSWDPVENASLLPWLAGTALLHSVVVLEKRSTLANWTIFLSILSFSFSLLGTFLVRSGILTSVHAFATDPARGVFILALLVVAIGGAFLFYALRAPQIRSGQSFELVSRETILLLNNLFLFTFCITVLMGTLYPLFMSALDLGSVSVGAPYYTAVLAGLLPVFALLLGAAPAVAWRKGSIEKLSVPVILTGLIIAVCIFLPMPEKPFSILGIGTGAWIILATAHDAVRKRALKKPRSYAGMVAAHIGIGVLIIGITAATLWREEKILLMQPGDHVMLGGQDIGFLGMHESRGANYALNTGIFTLKDRYLTPEKRWYPVQSKMTSEVSMKMQGLSLFYLVLGNQDTEKPERWVVRGYYHPQILLMVIGVLLILAGGALSLSDRRKPHE